MKKELSFENVTNQLNKLSLLIEEQQKFNHKYIASVLQSQNSSISSSTPLSQDNGLHIKEKTDGNNSINGGSEGGVLQNSNNQQEKCSEIENSIEYEEDDNTQARIPQDFDGLNANIKEIHQERYNSLHNFNNNQEYNEGEDENYIRKNDNKNFSSKLQKQLGRSITSSQKCKSNKNMVKIMDHHQQAKLKSFLNEQKQKLLIKQNFYLQCKYSNKNKRSQRNTSKNVTQRKNIQENQINCYQNAVCHSTENLQMSFWKTAKQMKSAQNVNNQKAAKQKQNVYQKSKNKSNFKEVYSKQMASNDKSDKCIKVRLPFSTIKAPLNKNEHPPHKLTKLDKNQLKKLKQKDTLHSNANPNDKKTTNRKTKRQVINKNKSTTKQQGKVNNIKTFKKNKSNYELVQEYQNGVLQYQNKGNLRVSSSKGWIKGLEKSNKKLNRINIAKLQQLKNNQNNTKKISKANKTKYGQIILQNNYLSVYQNFTVSNRNTHNENENESKRNKQSQLSNKKLIKVLPKINQNNQNNQNMPNCPHNEHFTKTFVQKLDFNKKIPIMERNLQQKNIFKSYNIMNDNYSEAAQKINLKYIKDLNEQIKQLTQSSIFKIKILTAIVMFLSQFVQPTSKNVMGIIAKTIVNQSVQQENLNKKLLFLQYQNNINFFNKNISILIASLLANPKDLLSIIRTLPHHLYNCNILSQASILNLLSFYQQITAKLDEDLKFHFFMLKKQHIYCYFHELVQFIKFLQANQLIEKTERKNLNISKKTMAGYYSSRSGRDGKKAQSKNKLTKIGKNGKGIQNQKKNVEKELKAKKKGCESERKLDTQDIQTERQLKVEALTKESNKGKLKKEQKQITQGKCVMQYQNKMNNSREKIRNK